MFLEVFNDLLSENYLNRKQFAERSGIPYPTVIGWTNLNRLPDYYALIKIADFFGCSVDYLMGRQNDFGGAQTKQQEERALIAKYRRLNQEDKNLVSNLIDRLS